LTGPSPFASLKPMRFLTTVLLLLCASGALAEEAHAPTPRLGRAVEAQIELADGDVAVRFSFPVRVPSWYLWQHATDCKAYLKHIREIAKCTQFVQDGRPAVLLEGKIVDRPYALVVGLSRQYQGGAGKLEFETRNLLPRQARGALRVERARDGEARIEFEARVPKDPAVPDLLVRLGVMAAVHEMAARVQGDLERDFRAFQARRVPEDLRLHHPRPPRP
jgi:hypothetical protein